MSDGEARRAAEAAARHSYGRLLAFVAARTRDVAAAEDALSEAFRAALSKWPERGVPERPEAWLLTAARRSLMHAARHARVAAAAGPTLAVLAEEAEAAALAPRFPDERLKLLFVCAHPAIEAGVRAPLMLQAVLGLDAAAIGSAFLVSPAAMGQRLVRAKSRIRDAGIAFRVPEEAELPERLEAVLDAVYVAFGSGWEDVGGADPRRRHLAEEAIWLGRLLAELLPRAPEAAGLLALMLHCEARRPARRDAQGCYVPLEEQDVSLWSRPLIAQAEAALGAAAAMRQVGRFQLEAAIQSAHVERRVSGSSTWEGIVRLYEGLVAVAPSLGALLGRAAAVAEAQDAAAGFALLAALPAEAATHQPYWALKAHLHDRLGERVAAAEAYARAVSLTEDAAVRAWLMARAAV